MSENLTNSWRGKYLLFRFSSSSSSTPWKLIGLNSYVDDLSVKKQDKALIHSRRARNIKIVLTDPKDTAIESAQFRYVFQTLDRVTERKLFLDTLNREYINPSACLLV